MPTRLDWKHTNKPWSLAQTRLCLLILTILDLHLVAPGHLDSTCILQMHCHSRVPSASISQSGQRQRWKGTASDCMFILPSISETLLRSTLASGSFGLLRVGQQLLEQANIRKTVHVEAAADRGLTCTCPLHKQLTAPEPTSREFHHASVLFDEVLISLSSSSTLPDKDGYYFDGVRYIRQEDCGVSRVPQKASIGSSDCASERSLPEFLFSARHGTSQLQWSAGPQTEDVDKAVVRKFHFVPVTVDKACPCRRKAQHRASGTTAADTSCSEWA